METDNNLMGEAFNFSYENPKNDRLEVVQDILEDNG